MTTTMPQLEDAGLNAGSGGGSGGPVDTGLNLTGDGTIPDPVRTLSSGLRFGTGTPFSDTGQANQGSTWRAAVFTDGTVGAPINDAQNPTLLVQRSDATIGTIIPFQFTLLRKGAADGFCYTHDTFVRQEADAAVDTVALSGRIFADAATPTSGQTNFGGWLTAARLGSVVRLCGAEIDVVNGGADAAEGSGSATNSTIGLQIVTAGLGKNSVLLDLGSPDGATAAAWNGIEFGPHTCALRGIHFKADSIEPFGYAIDCAAIPGIAPIRFPNNTPFLARDFANAADLYMVGLSIADEMDLHNDDAVNFVSNDGLTTFGRMLPTQMEAVHFAGNTSDPAIAAGPAAGTAPTVSIDGNDFAGTITVTTGTTATGSDVLCTVTFDVAYLTIPRVIISPANSTTAALYSIANAVPYSAQADTTTALFKIRSGSTALGDGTTYIWNYLVGA